MFIYLLPLFYEQFTFAAGRSNVIITYPGSTDKCVSFVGSHMDTVPADPEQWSRDPFVLERDGDKLYGRGMQSCVIRLINFMVVVCKVV